MLTNQPIHDELIGSGDVAVGDPSETPVQKPNEEPELEPGKTPDEEPGIQPSTKPRKDDDNDDDDDDPYTEIEIGDDTDRESQKIPIM